MSSTENILKKYIPQKALEKVLVLLKKYPIQLTITKERKTKLGDYRLPKAHQPHRISINGNLNPYAFLITLLHEYAHLVAFDQFGKRIKPHGTQWQETFLEIALPFIKSGVFPPEIANQFLDSLKKGQASSSRHIGLQRALAHFDHQKEHKVTLETLKENSTFAIGKKIFSKGPLMRKRYRCTSVSDKKQYAVHPLAEVTPLNHD